MQSAFALLMDMLGGAKAATPGNPAAVPPVLPTPAVGRDKWKARFWFTLGFLPALAIVLCLMYLGIGVAWKDAGLSFPSWGSSAQAQPAVTVTNTVTEVEKINLPPSEVKDNLINITGNGSYGEIHGPVVKVYPNAKVVPPKFTPETIIVGGEGNISIERSVPVGKALSFTPPQGVTVEWKDQAGQWAPAIIGKITPNQQTVRFMAKNPGQQVKFDLLWSDIY